MGIPKAVAGEREPENANHADRLARGASLARYEKQVTSKVSEESSPQTAVKIQHINFYKSEKGILVMTPRTTPATFTLR